MFGLLDANLHLWLDEKSSYTSGSLIKYEAPEYVPSLDSQFRDLDGRFKTSASRYISSTGWVKSSYGKITAHFFQKLHQASIHLLYGTYTNQTIDFNYGTYTKRPSSVLYSGQFFRSFPLYVYSGTIDRVNDSYTGCKHITRIQREQVFRGEIWFYIHLLEESADQKWLYACKGEFGNRVV